MFQSLADEAWNTMALAERNPMNYNPLVDIFRERRAVHRIFRGRREGYATVRDVKRT